MNLTEFMDSLQDSHSGFSEAEICKAEERIGVKLPQEYRDYLKQYGKDAINQEMHSLQPPEEIETSYWYIEDNLTNGGWQEEFEQAEKDGTTEEYEDNGYYKIWRLPKEKWHEITENYVLIWAENQGVWFAGYKLSDLAQGIKHPPIYMSTNDDFITFQKCSDSTEDFLKMMFDEAQ